MYRLLFFCILSQLFPFYPWPIRPDRILALLTLVFFVAAAPRREIARLKLQSIDVCMILFTILCGVSLIRGDVMALPGVQQATFIQQAINISLFPFLFYFVARHLNYNRDKVQALSRALMLMGLYLGLTALCERYSINALIWPSYIADPTVGIHFGRARGPLLSSVDLGMTLVFCTMITLTLWSVEQRAALRRFLGAVILLGMVGVYLTNTRGAWMGLGAAFMTVLFFRVKMRRMVTIALGLVVFGSVFLGPSKFSAFQPTLFSQRQSTVLDREVQYTVALKTGMDNPLLGIGWGRMGQEFAKYYKMIGAPKFTGWDGNHDEYLGIFAQAGIIALIFFGIILLSVIRMILATYRALPTQMEFERAFAVSTLGCVLCYMTMAVFSSVNSCPLINNLVFLLAGITASVAPRSRNALSVPASHSSQRPPEAPLRLPRHVHS